MESKKYRLRYLPLFEQDLAQAVAYIADVLKNPDAVQRTGGRERNPVCLLPCHSHCHSPVPQPHDGQAFFE